MAVSPTTGVPAQIDSGDTTAFLLTYADYAPGSYTLTFALSLGTLAPIIATATTSGTSFLVTLTAAITASLTVGNYTSGQWQYVCYVTDGSSNRYTAEAGSTYVLPNAAVAATATFAQSQVALFKTVMAAFGATDKKEVDFNGQKFVRFDIQQYQKQLTYWEARVIREQTALKAQRGEYAGGRIDVSFPPAAYPGGYAGIFSQR